jgi:N-acetylmuramoyl-L-alanine amidase
VRFPALIFLCVLLIPLEGIASAWNVVMHGNRRHVPIEDVARFYKLGTPVKGEKEFRIESPGRSIRGKLGTREVFINNVKYILCFPIVKKGGSILISAMDVTKILEPVLRPGKIKNAGPVRTVVLDAGHGGHDSGATGRRGMEKEAALDVVLRAKRLLEAQGYTVRLTRSRDVFVPLEQRAAYANRFPDAIFVSVHFNKSSKGTASGIETFALAPRGVPSMDEQNFSYSDLKQHPGHARDPENIALATALHSSMLRKMRLYDRGIKRARFAVIRNIRIPGVLLEGGFMNHPVDSQLIASSSFRDSFAKAILEGVNRYSSAISGRSATSSPAPSAVATATDATSVPDIRREFSPIRMSTTLNEAVQRASETFKKEIETNGN